MADRRGQRPLSMWGDGDLPAPYAVGDVLDIPEGAPALQRMNGWPPGRYRIVCAFSIDDGDAWYFRVGPPGRRRVGESSDRLHVVSSEPGRVSPEMVGAAVDWLERCTLVSTADPAGAHRRAELLSAGWRLG